MIYSVTALSGGKRLVCYYDITDMKNREADLADAKDKTAELFADLRGMVDFDVDRHSRSRSPTSRPRSSTRHSTICGRIAPTRRRRVDLPPD